MLTTNVPLLFLLVLAAAAVVNASLRVRSTAGLSSCLLNCVSATATNAGCSSYTDLECVCTSTKFQHEARTCLAHECTSADQATALQLQKDKCATLSTRSGTSRS